MTEPSRSRNQRRGGQTQGHHDTGDRRRRQDRVDDFRYRRDQILLFVGIGGILVIAILNSTIGFRDAGVAYALIAAFAGFAGAPTVLRLDERRRDDYD